MFKRERDIEQQQQQQQTAAERGAEPTQKGNRSFHVDIPPPPPHRPTHTHMTLHAAAAAVSLMEKTIVCLISLLPECCCRGE